MRKKMTLKERKVHRAGYQSCKKLTLRQIAVIFINFNQEVEECKNMGTIILLDNEGNPIPEDHCDYSNPTGSFNLDDFKNHGVDVDSIKEPIFVRDVTGEEDGTEV